ncbi:AfsR/SARP family transcriptional regulator [Micromonospora siamensis]|uniref:Tetratricopeptide repeat-containing protein n=1 Tax=Micromonospora siamensis TaxID=299152 RepID=A0A1C5J9R7_9ACTN|nr:BTAD domain-containing putative transcriptional regulator [Micromonospora siamensis]SCG66766.1 Tetratricopeptide repeat-containing protein [Micromonospora siamensis]
MRFFLLGTVTVEAAGVPLKLGGVRQARLLAILLSDVGSAVPDDLIVEALWEQPPRSARQQVYNAVNGLRRAFVDLGSVSLVRSGTGYTIHVPEMAVDTYQFRANVAAADQCQANGDPRAAAAHLQAALDLWRGPALSGLLTRSAPLQIIAARLEQERAVASDRLMTLGQMPSAAVAADTGSTGQPARAPWSEAVRPSVTILRQRDRHDATGRAEEYGRSQSAEERTAAFGPPARHSQNTQSEVERLSGSSLLPVTFAGSGRSATDIATPSINYLPRDTNEFTGRAREIRELTAPPTASTTALRVLTIDGVGGIGKTALAVRAAHHLVERYPDGQFFVDLLGFTPGATPMTAEDALDVLLLQSRVPRDMVPPGRRERSELWRTRLAGKRALIVLDNAADEAQIRDLLPGAPESLVLVTSRRRLSALDGAVPFSLDILPREDAVDLFVRIAGEHRVDGRSADVEEVIDLCGRQPHAVRTAAARFRDRVSWRLADLLEQMRPRRQRVRFLAVGDQNVISRLAASYERLTPPRRRLFRLLSLHPAAEFDAPAAAALAGMTLEETEECLEVLFEDNLVLQPTADRFVLHGLLRDCAFDLLRRHDSQEAQRKATHRVLDHYLYSAHSWSRPDAVGVFRFDIEVTHRPKAVDTPADDLARIRLIRANQRSVVAAARHAAKHGWHDHAWKIACSMMPFLARGGYAADSYPLFQIALAAAIERRDPRGEMMSMAAMAFVMRDREKEPERAQQLFEQAIRIAVREGDHGAHAYLAADLGMAQRSGGRMYQAQRTFAQVKELAAAIDDRWLTAAAATNLGVIALELGRYAEALRHLDEATTVGRGVNTTRAGLLIDLNVGLVNYLRGREVRARDIFDRVVADARDAGSLTAEAWTCSLRSVVSRSLGDLEGATEDARHALSLARILVQPEIECDALNAMGETLLSARDLAGAETSFQQAETVAEKFRLRSQRVRAVEGRAHVLWAAGEPRAARTLWQQALSLHPPGVMAAEFVRAHLSGLVDGAVKCPRCHVVNRPASTGDESRMR